MSFGRAQNMKKHHQVKLARNYNIPPFEFLEHMTGKLKKAVEINFTIAKLTVWHKQNLAAFGLKPQNLFALYHWTKSH